MLIRGYYFCESQLCNYEIAKGEAILGLFGVVEVTVEEPVKSVCFECGSEVEKIKLITHF